MKLEKRQKAITVYLLASSLISEEDESLQGKALTKIRSIETKLKKVLFAHGAVYQNMMKISVATLEKAGKEIGAGKHSPLMVGLHVLGDNRALLEGVSGFNMNFNDIDSLCNNIVDEANMTLDEIKECSKLAERFQKYIQGRLDDYRTYISTSIYTDSRFGYKFI